MTGMGSCMFFVFMCVIVVAIFRTEAAILGESKHVPKQKLAGVFQKIMGPKSLKDRIAIVGGGASGIHMAYMLKKLGFKDITIFEKEDRLGGKAHTIYHRRDPHEMGTVYTQPDYTEIYNLVREFDTGKLLPMPEARTWRKSNNGFLKTSCLENMVLEIPEIKPGFDIRNRTAALLFLSDAVRRYVIVHTTLFGDYEGELMPRPSKVVLMKTNMTFEKFLRKHDVEILKHLFVCTQTVQGYGHIDEIPALYGLLWMTPNFLTTLMNSRDRPIFILSKGFQFLVEEIAKQNNLNVKLNHEVERIYRLPTKTIIFHRSTIGNCRPVLEKSEFNFLILSPEMKTMGYIMRFTLPERRLFYKTNRDYYTTTLVDHSYSDERSNTPQDYFLSNVYGKQEMAVWVLRDSYASLNYITGKEYRNGTRPGGTDGKPIQTSVIYQYSKYKPNNRQLNKQRNSFFKNVLKSSLVNVTVVARDKWPYFPKYSAKDLTDGVLWDIFDTQGYRNTWYIGSSVCFESIKSVVEYNLLLLRNYDVPKN